MTKTPDPKEVERLAEQLVGWARYMGMNLTQTYKLADLIDSAAALRALVLRNQELEKMVEHLTPSGPVTTIPVEFFEGAYEDAEAYRARFEEARRDVERMDWIEMMGAGVYPDYSGWVVDVPECVNFVRPILREAIDAARGVHD